SAGARLPAAAGLMLAESRQFLPVLPAIGRLEERRVLDAGINRVRIGQRRLEVPDPREFPRMRRAAVPLVGARDAVVLELVADRFPGLACVVRALHHLAEPAARLRRGEPIRIRPRSFDVIDLPAREVRAADIPFLALPVRCQDEGALPGADQHAYAAHSSLLFEGAQDLDRKSTR